MKKLVLLFVTIASVSFGQLAVPPGAVMEAVVKATVPVSEIKVTMLTCDLSATNAPPVYTISFDLIDAGGNKTPKTFRVTSEQASQMMIAAGYSLTNIVSSALGAIQIMVDQKLAVQP